MIFSDYLTIADSNTEFNNDYAIPPPGDNVKQIEPYLMSEFFKFLNFKPIGTVFDYLDFHFNQFIHRNPGKEMSFFSFLRECTRGNGMVETGNGTMLKMYTPIFESRGETIREWIETQKNEIKNKIQPTPDNQQRNKTYITHPQQILLFHELGIIKYLKDKFQLGNEQTAEIISLLANRGKDNTGDYIRYLDQPKDKTAKSKRNVNPQTPDNIEFIRQLMSKLNLPE